MANFPFFAGLRGGLFVLFALFSSFGFGQGAWVPSGGDFSYPRTLVKQSEIPALRNYLTTPVANGLFTQLWGNINSYSPGNFQTDGQRRQAAHAAKNAAFFYLLNRKPVGGGLDTLTTTEANDLRDLAIFLMESMNTSVAAYPTIAGYLWRSNEIMDNTVAFDLLKGAGVPDSLLDNSAAKLQEYCGNLYKEVEIDLFNLGFFTLHVDNHALRTCGALGIAAVVLNDLESGDAEERPINWINCALYNIDNVLWRDNSPQSKTGMIGGYSEGPHYLRFGFKHVLPFMHAMGNFLPDVNVPVSWDGNNRTVRNPWFDENFDNLFEWYMRIRLPDGRPPNLEDCFFVTAWEELAIRENSRFTPIVDYSRFHTAQPDNLWEMLHHSSDDVVADYLASMTPDQADSLDLFQVLPESGNLVFRSGWDPQDVYMHFTAKNGITRIGAKGHNQADVSSFIVGGYGEVMALDAGYLKWSRRSEVGEATNHNMMLVNGQGPLNGAIGSANDADGFIDGTFELGSMQYGEVETAYRSSDFIRKNLMLRHRYFILNDHCESNQSRDFKWQLHGYGLENGNALEGTFEDGFATGQGTWRRNAASLLATVTAEGGVDQYSKATNIHEWRYDSLQQHTTMYAEVQNSAEASFLSVLFPYAIDTPEVAELCAPDCGSVLVLDGGFRDVATVAGLVSASASGLPGDLMQDGEMAVYSQAANGAMAGWLLENGENLSLGSFDLCSLSVAGDMALEAVDTATYACYNENGGMVFLQGLAFEPLSVNGVQVQNWQFDISTQTLQVQLGAGGYFSIHEGVVVKRPKPFELDWVVYPNPSAGSFWVETEGDLLGENQILVHDAMGRLVSKQQIESPRTFVQGLEQGIYLVTLETELGRMVKKVVVE